MPLDHRLQLVTIQDCSPHVAAHLGREWLWAVPPQAAQPTATPYP